MLNNILKNIALLIIILGFLPEKKGVRVEIKMVIN